MGHGLRGDVHPAGHGPPGVVRRRGGHRDHVHPARVLREEHPPHEGDDRAARLGAAHPAEGALLAGDGGGGAVLQGHRQHPLLQQALAAGDDRRGAEHAPAFDAGQLGPLQAGGHGAGVLRDPDGQRLHPPAPRGRDPGRGAEPRGGRPRQPEGGGGGSSSQPGSPTKDKSQNLEQQYGRCVTTLHPGDGFGERALLQTSIREASAITSSPAELLVVHKMGFNTMIHANQTEASVVYHPERLRRLLQKPPDERTAEDLSQLVDYTAGLQFFKELSTKKKLKLSKEVSLNIMRAARYSRVNKDTPIVRQGDEGATFFIIISGMWIETLPEM